MNPANGLRDYAFQEGRDERSSEFFQSAQGTSNDDGASGGAPSRSHSRSMNGLAQRPRSPTRDALERYDEYHDRDADASN